MVASEAAAGRGSRLAAAPLEARELKPYSMTRKLIATVLLVELVTAVCISGMALVYERHIHFRSFDVMLRGRAEGLLGAVQDSGDAQDNVMLDRTVIHTPSDDVYEVRDDSGRLVGRTPNWAGAPADLPINLIERRDDGFLRLHVGGERYRAMRLHGLRVVDPGDKGGGTPRHVVVLYASPTATVWKAVLEAAGFYAGANLVLLLVTGAVMAWLLSRGLDPLRLLAAEASGVSVSSWRFDPPESSLRMRELAPLAIALQTVLASLERSFLQQRRFVGDAAHELKTAVAVVKSSLQLLAMKPRTAEEYRAGLERCEADCERMEEIVFKMLTLARVDGGEQTRAGNANADLAAGVLLVTEQFERMAVLRRVRLIVTRAGSGEPVWVGVGAQECSLLLSNLVLNALQHSFADSEVVVSVTRDGSDAELRVEDSGSGIDPAALPHVFDRFFRGDASRDRSTGGTGLGLAICKAIVEAAGGSIAIESAPGAGTMVRVRLPLAAGPAADGEVGKSAGGNAAGDDAAREEHRSHSSR